MHFGSATPPSGTEEGSTTLQLAFWRVAIQRWPTDAQIGGCISQLQLLFTQALGQAMPAVLTLFTSRVSQRCRPAADGRAADPARDRKRASGALACSRAILLRAMADAAMEDAPAGEARRKGGDPANAPWVRRPREKRGGKSFAGC